MDVANKTIKELRAIGFQDIASYVLKPQRDGSMKPDITADEQIEMQKLYKEMEDDLNDPTSHLEGDVKPLSEQNDDLDKPKNEQQRVEFAKIKKQKLIDDQRIALVYQALEKGIPLPDDHLYQELLGMYPYY